MHRMSRIPIELRHLPEPKLARKRCACSFGAALSAREREVFDLYLAGLPVKEIGATLGGMDYRTVSTHKKCIMRKLGARHDVDLVRIAIRDGYTSLEAMQA